MKQHGKCANKFYKKVDQLTNQVPPVQASVEKVPEFYKTPKGAKY